MKVFIDTSGIYSALDLDDRSHFAAAQAWAILDEQRIDLITSNYVLLETLALIGRRLGLQAVRDFQTLFVPILHIYWVDASLHERAVAALLTAGVRDLSLVDCVSFELMRRLGIDTAFAFDTHFTQQGLKCIP